ncbi:uncharacterized protein LOC134672895 [Cydia fagiglandana]|uniref:uncharacterized protein LOC134672895 n=1 Tax=Cydia fagiglandana TaxID=1458189 RepID=UPI002FEE1459
MPYKIVKTYEKGVTQLTAVPSTWEEDGVLRWPRYNENKLRRIEGSLPDNSWRKINCQVKRSNLITFLKAEQEVDKMCKYSETETDADEQDLNYVTDNRDITFEEIVRDCIERDSISPGALTNIVEASSSERQENDVLCQIDETSPLENAPIEIHIDSNVQQNVSQPDKARNLGNSLILIQPQATNTDSNAQQNTTTEVQIDNASLTLMVLGKIETLQENYKTLNEKVTENIKAQQDDRKFISESIQSIMVAISNISVQFEHVMKQFSSAENKKQKVTIQNIASENDLNNFEKELENPDTEVEWKKKFLIICGKGKGRGINNAYALSDSMFTRSFLNQCSWAGGSRTPEQKICFKSHTKIINFFFDIVHESDSSFTVIECHQFFKTILKNSRSRKESKQERTSRTKNRPKIKANRKNLCNRKQTYLPITGTSAQENRSEASSPVAGTSASGPKNCSEVSVIGKSVLENNDQMSSASVAKIHTEITESLETSV